MIPVAFDLSEIRASSLSRRLEGAYTPQVSQVEIQTPDRVVASNPDPVAECTDLGRNTESSTSTLKLPVPDLAWTVGHEKRFLDLAGREATSRLPAEEQVELERLSELRRGLKNSRRGEELVWEYEQRELTRDLITALSRYVTFHNPPSRSSRTES
jgi:hypothetical protein